MNLRDIRRWSVLHSNGTVAEGILESRARARIQKRLCDEDPADSNCTHTVIQLLDIRLITADELRREHS